MPTFLTCSECNDLTRLRRFPFYILIILVNFALLGSFIKTFLFVFCTPDRVSAGADRTPGAGGDCSEVSTERSLGRGALRSLRRVNKSSAAGLPMIPPSQAQL